jgi:hypothetical protein
VQPFWYDSGGDYVSKNGVPFRQQIRMTWIGSYVMGQRFIGFVGKSKVRTNKRMNAPKKKKEQENTNKHDLDCREKKIFPKVVHFQLPV